MARESTQAKLTRVRPPRVQITYDVETGGAIKKKEIPFVMGVLGDFTGHPKEALPKIQERKFTELTPDNFDKVLDAMQPHLNLTVENKLSSDPDAGKLRVGLDFHSMDDFTPENVVRQVEPLRKLLALRTELSDLRSNLQSNQTLDEMLQGVIQNSEQLQQLQGEVKGDKP